MFGCVAPLYVLSVQWDQRVLGIALRYVSQKKAQNTEARAKTQKPKAKTQNTSIRT